MIILIDQSSNMMTTTDYEEVANRARHLVLAERL